MIKHAWVDCCWIWLAATLMCSCGAMDPWELVLAAEDWQVQEGPHIRLHFVKEDALLGNPTAAAAYLENCETWHLFLQERFDPPKDKVSVFQLKDARHWETVLGASDGPVGGGAIQPYNSQGRHPAIFLVGVGSIGHEMVHMMTYRESQPAPALLFEGLAVTYRGRYDESSGFTVPAATDGRYADCYPIHKCGAQFAASGVRPSEVPSYWNLLMKSTSLYVVSGSFVKYLIDQEGLETYMKAFRKASRSQLLGTTMEVALYEAYHKTMGELEQEWVEFLEQLYPEYFKS